MTLIVIFGAGATHDCAQDEAEWRELIHPSGWPATISGRPPLTKDLLTKSPMVQALLDRYKPAAQIVFDAREAFTDDNPTQTFEQFLREWHDRPGAEVQRAVRAVQFLLRDLLWAHTDRISDPHACGPVTNHVGLLSRLNRRAQERDEKLCLVSFNYDLVLENACQAIWGTFVFKSMADYVSHPSVAIIKPHGSVNWMRRLHPAPRTPGLTTAKGHVKAAEDVINSSGWIESETSEIVTSFERGSQETPWQLPVIALPVEGKIEAVCPEEHLGRMYQDLNSGPSRLLTIGWRGQEDHFLERLQNAWSFDNAKLEKALFVTGGGQAVEEAQALETAFDKIRPPAHQPEYRHRTDGFRGLPTSEELEWLLA